MFYFVFWEIDACVTHPCFGSHVDSCYDLDPPAGAGIRGRECICEDGFENYLESSGCVNVNVCKSQRPWGPREWDQVFNHAFLPPKASRIEYIYKYL